MDKEKHLKPEYEKPQIKTYTEEELQEEIGLTAGSTGNLTVQGGGNT